jgi:hypothetical protein
MALSGAIICSKVHITINIFMYNYTQMLILLNNNKNLPQLKRLFKSCELLLKDKVSS